MVAHGNKTATNNTTNEEEDIVTVPFCTHITA